MTRRVASQDEASDICQALPGANIALSFRLWLVACSDTARAWSVRASGARFIICTRGNAAAAASLAAWATCGSRRG